MFGPEGPAAEEIKGSAGSDHAMAGVEEIMNGASEQSKYSNLSTVTPGLSHRERGTMPHSPSKDCSLCPRNEGTICSPHYRSLSQVLSRIPQSPFLTPLTQELGAFPVKVKLTEKNYQLESYLKDVRGLLSTGLLEGFKVTYKKNEVENIGRISGQGYSCGCSECGYSDRILNAFEFEQHSGKSSKNQNDHIFLESGISLYRVVKILKHNKLSKLDELIEAVIGFPANMIEYNKWKASFQERKDYLEAESLDHGSTQCSRGSAVGEIGCSLTDYLKESTCSGISNLEWSVSRRRSDRKLKQGGTETPGPTMRSPDKGGHSTDMSKKNCTEETPSEKLAGPLSTGSVKPDSRRPVAELSDLPNHDSTNLELSLSSSATVTQEPPCDHTVGPKLKESKTRDTTLHPLLFKEGGVPDNTLLTYKLKDGEVLKQGYKRGTVIVCVCCNEEFTPSHFEEHAGMGRRRQPYHNIYTPEGLTLHKLALQLQGRLDSDGRGNTILFSFDGFPDLSYSGFGKESSTTSAPIVPLKRTLQERIAETESCYFCGDGCTTLGNISPDMIVFCNQCERPCHVKCYNKGLEKKVALKVLKEYTQFRFLCCEKCELLRAHLDERLGKCTEIAYLRQLGYISYQILSGMNRSNGYTPQVIDIFKEAFAATTAEDSDIMADMVNGKDVDEHTDFRGIYCAALTVSTHVVSAAIMKVRTQEVAELVLIATRRECRKKGYFMLLLKSIEENLREWNVNFLTAPVDPEMTSIWSSKLGFDVLSPEEVKSMLEAHPLVMFENLTLMRKSFV